MGGFRRGHETYEIPLSISFQLNMGDDNLTLPHMYVPENKARANQRKMNDVIDNPTHQL
jgi:hypothetical protein